MNVERIFQSTTGRLGEDMRLFHVFFFCVGKNHIVFWCSISGYCCVLIEQTVIKTSENSSNYFNTNSLAKNLFIVTHCEVYYLGVPCIFSKKYCIQAFDYWIHVSFLGIYI